MKRWLIVIAAVFVALWIFGGFQRHIPGQEEHPELAKVRLCDVVSPTHEGFIEGAQEEGLVREAGVDDQGVYVFEVDEARWSGFPIESQEVLAIAGWCHVAGTTGRGVAVVIGADSRNELASVVNGEFTTRE